MSAPATRTVRGRVRSIGPRPTTGAPLEFTLAEADGDFTLVQWATPAGGALRDGDVVMVTGTSDANGVLHAAGQRSVRVLRSPAWAWLAAPVLALAAHLAITNGAAQLADLEAIHRSAGQISYYREDTLLTVSRPPADASGASDLRAPVVLIAGQPLTAVRDLLPVFEQLARDNRPIWVVADAVEGEAQATFTVNNLRGRLIAGVTIPVGDQDRRRALLEDVAVLTGTRVMDAGLENLRLEELGNAHTVVLAPHFLSVMRGGGAAAVQARAETIRDTPVSSDADWKFRRLASILGAPPAHLYESAAWRVLAATAVAAVPLLGIAWFSRGTRGRGRVVVDVVGALVVVVATIAVTVLPAALEGPPWLVLELGLSVWIVLSVVSLARRVWRRS
jgi:hypothetical protein